MSDQRAGNAGSTVVRPVAVHAPAVGLLGLGGLLAILARTTGSGWLLVIAAGLVPLLALGVLAPAVTLLRVRASVRLPSDGTVGRSLSIVVAVRTRVRGVELRVRDPATGWIGVDGPASGTVRAAPAHRGVRSDVTVDLRCSAPFGLVSWRRTVVAACGRALAVGPAPESLVAPLTAGASGVDGSARTAGAEDGDAVRGIRPYTSGDSFRRVHWPATARWGDVMVRELEAQVPPRLVLVVDLRDPTTGVHPTRRNRRRGGGGPDESAESVASRAAGMVLDALSAGRSVVLATAEADAPVVGAVGTAVDAGRRLARAVAGAPGAPPVRRGDVVVRLAVEPTTGSR